MSISRVATTLRVSWHTAGTVIVTRAEQVLTSDPDRFGTVEVRRR
ncbi:hypothetical protein HMPREF1129_2953 [Actinomyces naeslundii str. Howell 279]|uniref:Uncharacterized protein n=1 Tax=Actinomyces naeslundii (strain ATCC 12104 / DSM 43013 / CCUG 2238 / JCM 8349 / NCTC 10301 / Howell 279) TaxID=1115803 RepID=J3F0M0_ACTNH|nr:hypothetical protein HMPREF1129_2953 [Actinomyces naeslundii str. Howell 279]